MNDELHNYEMTAEELPEYEIFLAEISDTPTMSDYLVG
jgi:hypothetical protein